MTNAVELFSKVVLLILLAVLFSHMLNGTATQWITSKIKAGAA